MAEQPADEAAFAEYIGRSIEVTDVVTGGPVRRLAATLDHEGKHWLDGALPPLAHWLFGLPETRESDLGSDGHPTRGEFLPPIALPRRMWAGGRVQFLAPILFGAALRRRTTIASIAMKKAGALALVTLRHEIFADEQRAVEEEQDLVFVPIAAPIPPRAVDLPRPTASEQSSADATRLFRYSALTFNAHRIHFDLTYARDVELYPGLVVHAPLQATMLADFALRNGSTFNRFDYRARYPLFAGESFTVARNDAQLWVAKVDGTVTMTADIE